MPCRSGCEDEHRDVAVAELPVIKQKLATVEAMLCGVIKAVGFEQATGLFDWAEAGITKDEFKAWWVQHQLKDAARRPRWTLSDKQRRLADLIVQPDASIPASREEQRILKELHALEPNAFLMVDMVSANKTFPGISIIDLNAVLRYLHDVGIVKTDGDNGLQLTADVRNYVDYTLKNSSTGG